MKLPILAILVLLIGCGGKSTSSKPNLPPIDPSGNWELILTDSSNNHITLSALFSQTGSVVTALNVLAVGNPNPFSCVPFTATFSNGQVLNVSNFTGEIDTPFGNIDFNSTLNDAGTQALGTYTLTGNCWGVASTGNFVANEVPSMTGTWTGTVTCAANCPTQTPQGTAGTLTATVTQDDSTGVVSGTYSVAGLAPRIVSGTLSLGASGFLSGSNWQGLLTDSSGNGLTIAGGPFQGSPFNTPGLGTDRSFGGIILLTTCSNPADCPATTYNVTMAH